MITNYTPLDLTRWEKDSDDKLNTVLLLIAILTAAVLALLLFVLIQKK